MNITPNERLLRLLLGTFETTLVPELSSPNAKAIAGIVQAVLVDLLKRESRTPTLVASCIADGKTLLADLVEVLARAGIQPAATPIATTASPQNLARGLEEHAALTEALALLTEQLAKARHTGTLHDEQAEQVSISELMLRAARWELAYNAQQEQALEPAAPTAPSMIPSLTTGALTAETLTVFVRSRHPDGAAVSVHGFEPIPGGFGKQTSRFSLRDARGGEQKLIARKSDPHPMVSTGGFIIESEFHLVKAVAATGYPAPRPLWLGTGIPGVDASFYVMERLPGSVAGSFLGGLAGNNLEALLLDVAAQLGRLHAYPREAFIDYTRDHEHPALQIDTVESLYRRQIAEWRRYTSAVEQLNSPFLQYLLDWLERHVPADSRPPVLVHGDFNIHNLLVEDGRVTGVLDWECAMFGAPEQDLAYIQPHISQHIAWDRFVARYRESGGRALDTASMPYYQAFSMLRLHVGMLRATRNLQTGVNDDIRYTMVELAFGTRFMEFGLAATQPQP